MPSRSLDAPAVNVNWRRTELRRSHIRCDLCGDEADTLHFLTEGGYPKVETEGDWEGVEVAFACPKHDAGGYWVHLDRWYDQAERFPDHIREKSWGAAALWAIAIREEDIQRAAALSDAKVASS